MTFMWKLKKYETVLIIDVHFYYSQISSSMRIHKNANNFLNNPVVVRPNYRLFKGIVDFFRIDNCIILIGSNEVLISKNQEKKRNFFTVQQNFDDFIFPPILEFVEPVYSTPFTISAIPDKLSKDCFSLKNCHKFQLPQLNELIPEEKYFSKLPYNANSLLESVSYPIHPSVEMWVMPYHIYNSPNVYINCEFRTTNSKKTASWEG